MESLGTVLLRTYVRTHACSLWLLRCSEARDLRTNLHPYVHTSRTWGQHPLTQVIAHNKADVNGVGVRHALLARGSMYWRAGRMLQAWPESKWQSCVLFGRCTKCGHVCRL